MVQRLILVAVLCFAPAIEAAAQTQLRSLCVIRAIDGEARVSARGAGSRPAEVGLGLGRNATLRTAAGTSATLQCDGGLRVVVGPEAEFAVLRVVPDAPRTIRVQILRGIAGFFFGDGEGANEVQVRTPSAVAAVRSTEWAIQVTDDASAVFAREGTVFVLGDRATVRLGPGDGVDVAADGTVGSVVTWRQPRIDLFAERLGPAW